MGYNVRKKADPVPARAPARAPFEVGFITALLCDVSPADQRFTHIPLELLGKAVLTHQAHGSKLDAQHTHYFAHVARGACGGVPRHSHRLPKLRAP